MNLLTTNQIFGMMQQMLPYVPLLEARNFKAVGSSRMPTFSADLYQDQLCWLFFWFNVKVGQVVYNGYTCDFIMNKNFINTNSFANFIEKWAYLMVSDGRLGAKSDVRVLKAGETV